jgi:hypothetical protein
MQDEAWKKRCLKYAIQHFPNLNARRPRPFPLQALHRWQRFIGPGVVNPQYCGLNQIEDLETDLIAEQAAALGSSRSHKRPSRKPNTRSRRLKSSNRSRTSRRSRRHPTRQKRP